LFLPAPVNGGSSEHDLEGQNSSLRQALADSESKSQELAATNQALQTGLETAEFARHNAEDRLELLQQRLVAETARANNFGVIPTPLAFQTWQAGHYQLINFNLDLYKCQFNDSAPRLHSTSRLMRVTLTSVHPTHIRCKSSKSSTMLWTPTAW
jgi:hypothetical protein